MKPNSGNVNLAVAVRVRPLNWKEAQTDGGRAAWSFDQNRITQIETTPDGKWYPSGTTFSFDHVFGPQVTTREVYRSMAKDLVLASCDGFNATIFAYGQTSSGKTHTIHGEDERDPGFIPLALADAFEQMANTPDREYFVRMSFIEIYNETIQDLLNPASSNLKISEDNERGVFIVDLKEEPVASPEQAMLLVRFGEVNRQIETTDLNERSSRSHTIVRVIIESKSRFDDGSSVRMSCLNLVDLAGSESIRLSADELRKNECRYINKSLLALGRVILHLSQKRGGHIPYRDSKLTRILQSALGGNSRTATICTVTPAISQKEETLNTLRFARYAQRVTNVASINEIASKEHPLLKEYQHRVNTLIEELEKTKEKSKQEITEKDRMISEIEKENELMLFALQEEEKGGDREATAAPDGANVSKAELIRITNEKQRLERENADHQFLIDSMLAQIKEHEDKQLQLEAQIERLNAQVTEQYKSISDLELENARYNELESVVDDAAQMAATDVSALRQQVKTLEEALVHEKARVEAESERRKRDLDQQKETMSTATAESNANLKVQVERLDSALAAEKKKSQLEIDRLRSLLETTRDDFEKEKGDIVNLIKNLKVQNSELKLMKEKAESEAKDSGKSNWEHEKSKLEYDLKRTQEQFNEARELWSKEAGDYMTRIEELEMRREEVHRTDNGDAKDLQKELLQMEESFKQEREQWQKKEKDLLIKIDNATAELKEAQAVSGNSARRVVDMEKMLKEALRKNEELKANLENGQESKASKYHQQQNSGGEDTNADMLTLVTKNLEKEREKSKRLEEKVAQASNLIDEGKIAELERMYLAEQHRRTELESQLVSIERQYTSTGQGGAADNRIRELEQLHESKIAELERMYLAEQHRRTELESRLVSIERQYTSTGQGGAADNRIRELEQLLADKEATYTERVRRAENRFGDLLASHDAERRESADTIASLTRKLADLSTALKAERHSAAVAERQKHADMQAISADRDRLQKEVSRLELSEKSTKNRMEVSQVGSTDRSRNPDPAWSVLQEQVVALQGELEREKYRSSMLEKLKNSQVSELRTRLESVEQATAASIQGSFMSNQSTPIFRPSEPQNRDNVPISASETHQTPLRPSQQGKPEPEQSPTTPSVNGSVVDPDTPMTFTPSPVKTPEGRTHNHTRQKSRPFISMPSPEDARSTRFDPDSATQKRRRALREERPIFGGV